MSYLGREAAKAPLVTGDIPDNSITAAKIVADTIAAGDLAPDSVDSSELVDGSIDTAHIADNQVTLAKMAGGTDGQIITYDASGDPVAVGPGSDGEVLTSTGAGSPPAFETVAIAGVTTGSGNVTITDGNLILDAGNGIDFSDTSDVGGMTSELLDDYEEGAFTPASNTVAFSDSAGTYTKIGRFVCVTLYGTWGGSGTPGTITGLPFACGARSAMGVVALNKVNTITVAPFAYTPGTTSYSYIWSVHDDTFWGNAISSVASDDQIQITMTYQI